MRLCLTPFSDAKDAAPGKVSRAISLRMSLTAVVHSTLPSTTIRYLVLKKPRDVHMRT